MSEITGSHEAPPAQPSRRLAAIMFTDLVGYSAMAHRDEALAIELLQLHRAWVREILPRYGGREIETVGDAFLIEFAGALAAVECAVAIQGRFAEHNAAAPPDRRMELRVGIHVGDVEHTGDKVFGDGINIASRIHGMAKPGGICVSEDVHHAVSNRAGLQFTSLGTPALKNIAATLELFELAPSMSLAPAELVAKAPVKKIPRWIPVAAAVAGVAVAIAGAAGWFATRTPHSAMPAIAVLPFENLSADPDSAFFTDGLHDTVIGHLSRVAGLKVISRTSVMGYRGKHPNLRQIASELGVTSILEGSVQRAGGRLRVTAQLIDTATDAHLWSSEYNRELKDVFEVQADIARQVANAVHATLTPQEQASIESIPTSSPAAYDLYLRAVLVDRAADPKPEQLSQAIGWLDEAVTLDPKFALAYALLADMHDAIHWGGYDPSDARRRQVGEYVERALQLEPALAEAHVAKALHLYHGFRSYEEALRELEIARGIAPGNAEAHYWLALIYRRQGRWDEALASFERATALDPLNAAYLNQYVGTLQMLRRYADADPVFARLAHLQSDDPTIPMFAAYNRFLQDGDLAAVDKVAAEIPAGVDPDCQVSLFRSHVAFLERRHADSITAITACRQAMVSYSGSQQVPTEYFIAAYRWLATGRQRPPEAAGVRVQLEKMLARRPDQEGVRMSLAFTLMMLGEPQQALAEADRALALMPLSRDALTGANLLRLASAVHANCGAEDRALRELEQLMNLPAGGSAQELKVDPMFDGLRKDPRFQKLLAEHLPKAGV